MKPYRTLRFNSCKATEQKLGCTVHAGTVMVAQIYKCEVKAKKKQKNIGFGKAFKPFIGSPLVWAVQIISVNL